MMITVNRVDFLADLTALYRQHRRQLFVNNFHELLLFLIRQAVFPAECFYRILVVFALKQGNPGLDTRAQRYVEEQ